VPIDLGKGKGSVNSRCGVLIYLPRHLPEHVDPAREICLCSSAEWQLYVASDLGDGMMPRVEVDRFDPGGDFRKYEEKVTLRLLPMSPHSLGLTAG
jgi:hypothetical protein